MTAADQTPVDQLEALGHDRFIVGDPEQCIAKIKRFQETFGVDHLICQTCQALVAPPSLPAATTVHEPLRRTKWCVMDFADALDERKVVAELVVQTVWAIPHDVEATALLRPVGSKRGDNHMPAGPNRITHAVNVALPIGKDRLAG